MSNTITLSEPSVDALIPTWTGLQIERGPNGTNLGAFALVGTVVYVSGQITYSYLDTGGAVSDWYRVRRYGPGGLLSNYSPAWPVTPQPITSGTGARRALKNNRRMLARRLQSLQLVTATEDGAINGTTFKSTQMANLIDANRYNNWYAMPTDGVSSGEIRVIGANALNPSTGELTPGLAFPTQIVRGTEVELHHYLPPDDFGGEPGLRQFLNLALAECWVLDRLALTTLANTVTYDISALGDWLDPDAIAEYYGPVLGAGFHDYPWGGFTPRRDGASVLLDIAPGLSPSATSIELTRPADSLIKINGVWTDGQQGFQNDDDECLLQPIFLTEVALVYAYEALAAKAKGADRAFYSGRAENQRTKVNIAKWRGLPHPPERADHSARARADNDWMSYLK